MLTFPESPLLQSSTLHLSYLQLDQPVTCGNNKYYLNIHIIYWISIYYSFYSSGFLCFFQKQKMMWKMNGAKLLKHTLLWRKFTNGCCNNKKPSVDWKTFHCVFLTIILHINITKQSSNQTSSNFMINKIATSVWYFSSDLWLTCSFSDESFFVFLWF